MLDTKDEIQYQGLASPPHPFVSFQQHSAFLQPKNNAHGCWSGRRQLQQGEIIDNNDINENNEQNDYETELRIRHLFIYRYRAPLDVILTLLAEVTIMNREGRHCRLKNTR